MDRVEIRLMRAEDLPRVVEIDQQSFNLPWPPSAFEYELNENPGSILWVAEAEDPETGKKVVGMVVIWLIVDEAHIATIAISPEYRGQEIAKKLLATALTAAANLNMRTATLEVRANNTAAQNLYRAFGFEVVGIRPRYYHDNNEDGLIMTLYSLDQLDKNNINAMIIESIAGDK